MADWRDEYWRETVEIAASECEATLTPEQIKYIAEAVQISHENYGIASGHDVASANRSAAIDQEKRTLRAELMREQEAMPCDECGGRGQTTTHGPYHSATSQCWKCRGKGRVYLHPVAEYERRLANERRRG